MACADLLEAEGRALRRQVQRTGAALALIIVAAAFLMSGLALVVLGVFWQLESVAGRAPAAMLCGLLSLVIAGGVAWSITRLRN